MSKLNFEAAVLSNIAVFPLQEDSEFATNELQSALNENNFNGEALQHFVNQVFAKQSQAFAIKDEHLSTQCNKLLKAKNFNNQAIALYKIFKSVFENGSGKNGYLWIIVLNYVQHESEEQPVLILLKTQGRQPVLNTIDFAAINSIDSLFAIGVAEVQQASAILYNNVDEAPIVYHTEKIVHQQGSQFWVQDFLSSQPLSEAFVQTQQYLNMAHAFVKQAYVKDFDVSKADEVDLMNRSVQYFKQNENFEEEDFLNKVVYHPEVKEAFAKFTDNYKEENNLGWDDGFEIDNQAVKNSSKYFSKVIKLDKNFHVYVHGSKVNMQKGYDEELGKNFYKLYFDEEH
jgi:hypothetical protein